jgi:hypothetical protein
VEEAGDHVTAAKAGGYDCVIGDRERKVGTYREFVLFDERQVLPEYAVICRRQYDKSKVPGSMHQDVRGTSGKNWQVKRSDEGWVNLPPNVSHDLNNAKDGGEMSLERTIDGESFQFDLGVLKQKNVSTGIECKIRPPMRR